MMSPAEISEWREEMRHTLTLWRDPDGELVPTEPDPDEREACRQRLKAAIETLDRVLETAAPAR